MNNDINTDIHIYIYVSVAIRLDINMDIHIDKVLNLSCVNVKLIKDVGRIPVERDTIYNTLKEY